MRVRNGDYVKAGEILIRLDDTDTRAGLEIINTQLYELLARKARLETERDQARNIIFPKKLIELSGTDCIARTLVGQRKLFVSRRDLLKGQLEQLSNQIVQLREEITGLNAQLDSKSKQVGFLNKELKGLLKLKKSGLVPVSRIMPLEREKARIEGERGQLTADIARVKTKIGETRLAIIQAKQDAATKVLEELREIQPRIAELFERRLSASAKLRRIDIVAPRAGFVHELQINGEGGVVGPGQVVMLIVPEKDRLIVSAKVNPQDIDQISIGQKVVVNFPAFSNSVTPSLDGEVYRIAADLTQEDKTIPPYYEVRIKLKPGEAEKLGTQQLKPGMPAEAYIQTKTRSALSYLIKPFTDQLNRAFREE